VNRRPEVVAFDVVETLLSLDPVRRRLEAAGPEAPTLELFFARFLRDAFALAMSGAYRRFPEVADGALAAMWPSASDSARSEVLGGFGELPAYPDAEPAMAQLAAAGVRVVTLSNGTPEGTGRLLQRTGLDRYVERVISINEVEVWKPAAAPYRHAASVAGVAPADLALVAVHAWDVHGAKRAGLTTGWASRLEGSFSPVFDPPDVQGPDLVAVAEALTKLG
jgi:2-haloacid dehalogenase